MAGLSARHVDALAGLTPGHTLAVERKIGDRVTGRTLGRIAAVFGCSMEHLLTGASPPSLDDVRAAVAQAEASLTKRLAEPTRRRRGARVHTTT